MASSGFLLTLLPKADRKNDLFSTLFSKDHRLAWHPKCHEGWYRFIMSNLAEREGFAPAVPIDNTQLVDSSYGSDRSYRLSRNIMAQKRHSFCETA